jgi:hypothetical protein
MKHVSTGQFLRRAHFHVLPAHDARAIPRVNLRLRGVGEALLHVTRQATVEDKFEHPFAQRVEGQTEFTDQMQRHSIEVADDQEEHQVQTQTHQVRRQLQIKHPATPVHAQNKQEEVSYDQK